MGAPREGVRQAWWRAHELYDRLDRTLDSRRVLHRLVQHDPGDDQALRALARVGDPAAGM